MILAGPLRRTALRHQKATDVVVAILLCTATFVTTAVGPGRLGPAAAVAGGIGYGALCLRRRWPCLVLAVSTAAAEVYMVLTGPHQMTGGAQLVLSAPLIALYTVAERTGGLLRKVTAGGLVVAALSGLHALTDPTSLLLGPGNVALAALGGLAIAAGDASRSRRAYAAEVEERARRAEQDREQEARRRVTEERLRIARDLHDVVGHQLALVNMQASVADHVLTDSPERAREALAHVRQSGRTALAGLRDTVRLLRQVGEPDMSVEPAAGLAQLEDLIGSFRRSGMRIEYSVGGAACPLHPAADLVAYRVVQESLTNASKHASGDTVSVGVDYSPAAVRIIVENDGKGGPGARKPAVDGGGHGILGMRERVSMIGGSLEAGPSLGGAFRVRAMLPLRAGGWASLPAGGRALPESRP